MLTVLRHNPSPPILTKCFFATGRSCIVHLIRKYAPGVAHLPEMFPEGLYMPFAKEGIKTTRYKLQPDLEPDLESLDYCLRTHKADRPLVVLVHYFGYWMPSYGPAALAHEHGGILFEDCAHCLPMKDTRGGCGDVQLFSINKLFPVTDGALMLSCSAHADLTHTEVLPPFQTEAVEAYLAHLAENRILAAMPKPKTDLERMLLSETRDRSHSAYEAYYKIISNDMEPRLPTRMLVLDDVEDERAKRIKNAEHLIDRLPAERLYRLGAPVFALPIKQWEDREDDISERFREAGVIPHRLLDKWTLPADGHFQRTHLLIPLQQKIEGFK